MKSELFEFGQLVQCRVACTFVCLHLWLFKSQLGRFGHVHDRHWFLALDVHLLSIRCLDTCRHCFRICHNRQHLIDKFEEYTRVGVMVVPCWIGLAVRLFLLVARQQIQLLLVVCYVWGPLGIGLTIWCMLYSIHTIGFGLLHKATQKAFDIDFSFEVVFDQWWPTQFTQARHWRTLSAWQIPIRAQLDWRTEWLLGNAQWSATIDKIEQGLIVRIGLDLVVCHVECQFATIFHNRAFYDRYVVGFWLATAWIGLHTRLGFVRRQLR